MAKMPRRVVVFLIVGVTSAVIDAGVFAALVYFGVAPVIATIIGFMCAFVVNFRGNRDLVFRAQQDTVRPGALVRYSVLVAVNLGLSAALVAVGIGLGLDPLAAKLISMVVIAIVNFWTMRFWVFAENAPPTDQ